jgi:hypothetical protein
MRRCADAPMRRCAMRRYADAPMREHACADATMRRCAYAQQRQREIGPDYVAAEGRVWSNEQREAMQPQLQQLQQPAAGNYKAKAICGCDM